MRQNVRNVERAKEARRAGGLTDLARDFRLALRSFARSPGFALAAVLVLATGIGATTAIFSAVRAVVLRPLPFSDPERLYVLWESNAEEGVEQELVNPANYLDWKERVRSFADVEAYSATPWQVPVTGLDRPRALSATSVTGGFFSMLGARPMLGRTFTEAETWVDAASGEGEVPLILSARTWRELFGGSGGAVGAPLTFNGGPARVVGVMPEGFGFPSEEVDLWVPAGWPSEARAQPWFRRGNSMQAIARLAPGATPEQAAAELKAVAAQLEREHPDTNRNRGAGMAPMHDFLVGDTRTPLLVLLGAVGLMLLIACANLGNLLLVRATGRRRELALRAALGAGRGHLVRQMLIESAALACLGGLGGIALGYAGTRLLEWLQPEGLLWVTKFPVDAGVVVFGVAATAVAALLFGTIPALLAGRSSPAEALRDTPGGPSRGAQPVMRGLVIAEVALAVLLVLGAGLLVRSIIALRQVDPGFDPKGVLAVTLNIPGARYQGPAQVIAFYDDVLTRVRALPGVESAAASSTLPLREPGVTSDFTIATRPPGEYGTDAIVRLVTPGYFETMKVPILKGRPVTETDGFGGARVALINEAMADQYFRGQDPVGQRITTERSPGADATWRTIVGVVRSERQSDIATPPQPEIIDPFAQDIDREMFLYVRVRDGDPMGLVPSIRRIVLDIDPELPLYGAVAMEDVVAGSTARDRVLMLLLVAFAAIAMVLALVGVYGVTAQTTRQRLPELALRMALGARATDVVWLTIRRSFVVVAAGLALGIAAALVTTRAMTSVLYGVTPNDPVTFAAVAALLAATGIVASWLPARRAARADPAATLRGE